MFDEDERKTCIIVVEATQTSRACGYAMPLHGQLSRTSWIITRPGQ